MINMTHEGTVKSLYFLILAELVIKLEKSIMKKHKMTATESMCSLIILLLFFPICPPHHVMKTICNAFSLHAVMISISLLAICICVTVALAGASQLPVSGFLNM